MGAYDGKTGDLMEEGMAHASAHREEESEVEEGTKSELSKLGLSEMGLKRAHEIMSDLKDLSDKEDVPVKNMLGAYENELGGGDEEMPESEQEEHAESNEPADHAGQETAAEASGEGAEEGEKESHPEAKKALIIALLKRKRAG